MRPQPNCGRRRLLDRSLHLFAKRAAQSCLLAGAGLVLTSCGGGGNATTFDMQPELSTTSDGRGETLAANLGTETGAPLRIVPVPGSATALVALFPDGRAYYSPDGLNLAGGGSTIVAYGGPLQVINIVAVSGGVDTLLSDGTVFFSPNGQNIGGGGATVSAYPGPQAVATLNPVGTGIDVVFTKGGGAVYSSTGQDIGGASSVSIYAGGVGITEIIAIGPGDAVVALLANGTAYYSPDNRNLGGGGNTVPAAPGAREVILELVQVGGGVLAEFKDQSVYLSPNGQNLAGGGATIASPSWNTSVANGPWPARDSAHGVVFLNRLWLSGGFSDATNSNSCFITCSFFDLWSSTDASGTTWNSAPSFATATTPDPRDNTPVVNDGVQDVALPTDFYNSYSALAVWNGQLTAMGSTVWRSPDGVTWARQNLADGTAAPGPVPAGATENSRAVLFGSALYFVQPDSGEVYRTTDPNAAVWTDLGAIPNFTPRCASTVFVQQGKIWVEGGGACDYSKLFNDIWSSADGVNWTESTKTVEWSARMWPCTASGDDGVVWLAGGYAPTDWTTAGGTLRPRYGANHSDVWYSKDGETWKQYKADLGSGLPDDGGLEPRHAPTCYQVAGSAAGTGSLVIMAGTGGPVPNDADAGVINSIRTVSLPAAASLP
jgi:hypothetical protein